MNARKSALATALLPALILAGIAQAASADAPAAAPHPGHGHDAPHWGYGKDDGPAAWATLSPEYGLCGSGREQTPIDLDPGSARAAATSETLTLDFVPGDHKLEEVNNGHTVQVNDAGGSVLQLGGQRYDLVQFHFHSPSEHKIAGKSYPMEIHLVHKSAAGKLAVLGIMVEEGAASSVLAPVLTQMPHHVGQSLALKQELDLAALLPKSHAALRYQGSLTTPPCSEGVAWIVLEQAITLSHEQVTSFSRLIGDDHRPVQPRNAREVSRIELGVR